MKRLYFAIAALALAACSSDNDEPATPAGPVTLSITADNTAMYQPTKDIMIGDFLADEAESKPYEFKVRHLIYDAQGKLVQSDSATSKSIGQFPAISVQLPQGDYTLVSVTSYANEGEADFMFETLESTDQLSTLSLQMRTLAPTEYALIGMKATSIQAKADESITVSPDQLGGLLTARMIVSGATKEDIAYLVTDDAVQSMRLSPNVPQSERYVLTGKQEIRVSDSFYLSGIVVAYVLDPTAVVNFAIGDTESYELITDNEEATPIPSGSNIYYGLLLLEEAEQPELTTNMTLEESIAWYESASERYRAEQEAKEAKDREKADAAPVLEQLNLDWGTSVSNVHAVLAGFQLTAGSATEGQEIPDDDFSYYLTSYTNAAGDITINNAFNQQSAGLFEVDVRLDQSVYSLNKICDYIKANYNLEYDENGDTHDGNMGIEILEANYTDDATYIVSFYDYDYHANTSFVRRKAPGQRIKPLKALQR